MFNPSPLSDVVLVSKALLYHRLLIPVYFSILQAESSKINNIKCMVHKQLPEYYAS